MRDVLLITLCLVSCGAPMPEDGQPGTAGAAGPAGRDGRDAVQAGSRLEPLYFKGADGARVASLWFRDKQTGEPCALQLASGTWGAVGSSYLCTPSGRAVGPGDADRMVRFTLEP